MSYILLAIFGIGSVAFAFCILLIAIFFWVCIRKIFKGGADYDKEVEKKPARVRRLWEEEGFMVELAEFESAISGDTPPLMEVQNN